MTGLNGTIEVRDFASNGHYETWNLYAPPSNGTKIRIYFTLFEMDDTSGCGGDHVDIYDSYFENPERRMVRLCGGVPINEGTRYEFHDVVGSKWYAPDSSWTTIDAAEMLVVFESDHAEGVKNGFIANWEVVFLEPVVVQNPPKLTVMAGDSFQLTIGTAAIFDNPPQADPMEFFMFMPGKEPLEEAYNWNPNNNQFTGVMSNDQVGVTNFELVAVNQFGYSATALVEITTLAQNDPDATSELECEFYEITDQTVSANDTLDPTSLQPVYCFIYPRNAGSSVVASTQAFDPKIETGAGFIDDYSTFGCGTDEFCGTLRFRFQPPVSGGITTISDGVFGHNVTITIYATPDDTSIVVCDKQIVTPSETIQCNVEARRGRSQIYTVYREAFFGSAVTDPYVAAGAPAAPSFVLQWDNVDTAASLFPFQVTFPNASGSYELLVADGGDPFTALLVADPDNTTSMTCESLYASVGAPVKCDITPRAGGNVIYTFASQIDAVHDPPIGEFSSLFPQVGNTFTTTFTATSTGTTQLGVVAGAKLHLPTLELVAEASADNSSYMVCGAGTVRVNNNVTCDIFAQFGGNPTSVLASIFRISVQPSDDHLTTRLREYGSAVNSPVLADDYLADKFSFEFAAGSTSGPVDISNDISTPTRIVVTNDPDATSTVACPESVDIGGTITCSYSAALGSAAVYVHPSQLTAVVSEGTGTTDLVFNSDAPPGLRRTEPGRNFEFDYVAPVAKTGTATVRIEVAYQGDDPSPGQYAQFTLSVVTTPDTTSTLGCRTNTVAAGAPLQCWIVPRKADAVVRTLASRLAPYVVGDGTVSELTPAIGTKFFFTVTLHTAHDEAVVAEAKTNSVSITSQPSGAVYSWGTADVIDPFLDETTYTYIFGAQGIYGSYTQGELRAPLGHTETSLDFHLPKTVNVETATSNGYTGSDPMLDVSCSALHCVAATASGSVVTWGIEDEEILGHDSDGAAFISTIDDDGTANDIHELSTIAVQALEALQSETQSIALVDTGAIYVWGKGVTGIQQLTPETVSVTKLAPKGQFFMASTASGGVYTWGPPSTSFFLGRGGDASTPISLSFPNPQPTSITSLVAGSGFGIVLADGGTRVFSWGYSLSQTVLPSNNLPEERTGAWNLLGKTITQMDGGFTTLVAITDDGKLYGCLMYAPADFNAAAHDFEPVSSGEDLDGNTISLLDRQFRHVSAGNPVTVASDKEGSIWVWQAPYEDPASQSQSGGSDPNRPGAVSEVPTLVVLDNTAEGRVPALVHSSFIQIVPVVPTDIYISLDNEAGACGPLSVNCSSLEEAIEQFPAAGTRYIVLDGDYDLKSTLIISVKDAQILSLSGEPTDVSFDCNGHGCISFSTTSGAHLVRGIRFYNGSRSVDNPGTQTVANQDLTTQGWGGCFRVEADQRITLERMMFTGCRAPVAGGLFIGGEAKLTAVEVSDSEAYGGDAGGVYVYEATGTVEMTNCRVLRNSAPKGGGGGIKFISSTVEAINLEVADNVAFSNGGGVAIEAGELSFVDSRVMNNNATSNGGGFHVRNAEWTLHSVVVGENRAIGHAGGIYNEFATFTSLSSTIRNNSAGDLWSVLNGLVVEFGNVNDALAQQLQLLSAHSNGGGLYILGDRPILVRETTLAGNVAANEGGGLFTIYCSPFFDKVNLFTNTALRGGGMCIAESTLMAASSIHANGNMAIVEGGGVMFSEHGDGSLLSSTISNNKAGTSGGGLFYGSSAFISLTNTAVYGNVARSGGGLYFTDTTAEPDHASLSINSGNAATHGPDRATVATSFVFDDTLRLPTDFEATSGVVFDTTIRVKLVDFFGQVVTTDSDSAVTVINDHGYSFVGFTIGQLFMGQLDFKDSDGTAFGVTFTPGASTSFRITVIVPSVGILSTPEVNIDVRGCVDGEFISSSVCQPCPAGTYSDIADAVACTPCSTGEFSESAGSTSCTECPAGRFATSGSSTTCVECTKGTYAPNPGSDVCTSCEVGKAQADFGEDDCEVCPPGTAAAGGATACSPCISGTVAKDAESTTCVPCQDNALSVNGTDCFCQPLFFESKELDSSGNPVCKDCPEGAYCDELGTTQENMRPLGGWWPALNSDNLVFVKCLNAACLTPSQSVSRSGRLCEEGYDGNLCTECEYGYGRANEYDCEKCPPRDENRLRLLGLGLLLLVLCGMFTYFSIKKALDHTSSSAILLKIMISCLQFNAIAASFQFEWPSAVDNLLKAQQRTANIGTSMLNVDCFLEEENETSPFYLKSLLFMFLPMMVVTAPWLVFIPMAIKMIRDGVPNWKRTIKDYYSTTVVVILFILHPSITQQTFLMFSCKQLGETGDETYLLADLTERCWTDRHVSWVMLVGMPMLVFYVFGIPAVGLKILYKHRYELDDERVRKKYSFLYQGFELEYFFWEIVVVARKVGIVAIAVFFVQNVHVQALMAVLLVTISLLAHVFARPFEANIMDWMEFFSLITSFATFWSGQFLFVEDLSDGDRVGVSFLIIFCNVGFLLAAVVTVILELRREKRDAELDAEYGTTPRERAEALRRKRSTRRAVGSKRGMPRVDTHFSVDGLKRAVGFADDDEDDDPGGHKAALRQRTMHQQGRVGSGNIGINVVPNEALPPGASMQQQPRPYRPGMARDDSRLAASRGVGGLAVSAGTSGRSPQMADLHLDSDEEEEEALRFGPTSSPMPQGATTPTPSAEPSQVEMPVMHTSARVAPQPSAAGGGEQPASQDGVIIMSSAHGATRSQSGNYIVYGGPVDQGE